MISTIYHFEFPATALSQSPSSIFWIDQSRHWVKINSWNHIAVPATKDENGYYFIDRSPKYFESILNFLRTGEIESHACLDMRFLLKEAEYYGIEGMAVKIREELQKKQGYENMMRENCQQLNCIQQTCQNYLR